VSECVGSNSGHVFFVLKTHRFASVAEGGGSGVEVAWHGVEGIAAEWCECYSASRFSMKRLDRGKEYRCLVLDWLRECLERSRSAIQ
jgi:hypothetical protein